MTRTPPRISSVAAVSAGVIAVAVLLTGCVSSATSGTATSAPPTASAPSTPSQSPASPTAPATPASTPDPSATTQPGSSLDGAKGCRPNGVAMPAGAATANVGDMDGDGKADTAFYTEAAPSGGFSYGIHTASGATVFLRDDLAGPGAHSGWTAALDGPAIRVTVLDDGRSASLHAFINCGFRTTKGSNGQPYRFTLAGFGDYGTGVACNNRNGGTIVEGALAKLKSNGRYDIQWTQINLSADGRTATNGAVETRYANLAKADARVRQAMGSYCNDAPKVSTSGK